METEEILSGETPCDPIAADVTMHVGGDSICCGRKDIPYCPGARYAGVFFDAASISSGVSNTVVLTVTAPAAMTVRLNAVAVTEGIVDCFDPLHRGELLPSGKGSGDRGKCSNPVTPSRKGLAPQLE